MLTDSQLARIELTAAKAAARLPYDWKFHFMPDYRASVMPETVFLGPWAVAFIGEGAGCCIIHGSLEDVAAFMGREDQTPVSPAEWMEELSSDDNWKHDERGHRFQFWSEIGECASVCVTRITMDEVPAGNH